MRTKQRVRVAVQVVLPRHDEAHWVIHGGRRLLSARVAVDGEVGAVWALATVKSQPRIWYEPLPSLSSCHTAELYTAQARRYHHLHGDSPSAGEPADRGFVSFDLGQASVSLIQITAAELSCSIALVYGRPFTGLGDLHVDHIAFDLIGDEAFSLASLPERQSRTTPTNLGDVLAVDALAAVRSD